MWDDFKWWISVQVEADLAAANGKFLQLHGPAGGAELDLYGRAATLHPHEHPSPATSRAGSLKERNTSKTGRLRYVRILAHTCFRLQPPKLKEAPLPLVGTEQPIP